jgi:ribonucleoside-diphosphate reductase alpha subunit
MAPFSMVMKALYDAGQIRDDFIEVVNRHADKLDEAIDYERDNLFTYFGFRTFEHGYGLCIRETNESGKEISRVYERPQHMWMRVALALHLDDIDAAIESYNWMSCMYFTHASPTLMNAGKRRQQMSSCFLVAMKEEDHSKDAIIDSVARTVSEPDFITKVERPDSIPKIFETVADCARISASSGGIGLHCSIVRGEGSPITSAGRAGSGLIPMLRNFEAMANYVDQGRKRKGAVAVYLEPWHVDIEDFLLIKENTTESKEWKEAGKQRMRDLHVALWIPDIFMQRVDQDGDWSLMCPFYSPDLQDLYDDENKSFTKRYLEYEAMGAPYVRRTIKARDLWTRIIDAQIHTGEPYMCYKDAVNRKTNHKNLGTVKSSNLCSEIVQYSSSDKTAVCNLASISLKSFVDENEQGEKFFDHDTLAYVVKMITRNLDRIIDINYYPTKEARNSNMSERPMGIGVQGLADTFIRMGYPYDSEEAAQLNREIFETIYFAAVEASCELATELREPYATFKGSPLSQGKFQFDLWRDEGHTVPLSGRWDWDDLRSRVKKHGVRNSLLVALMPTASTSQLLGNNESFEPYTNNMYVRTVLSGSFKVVNRQMILDLIETGLWTVELRNKIIALGGDIQHLDEIPQSIRDLYKTSYGLKQRVIVDQAADRAPFVDQSMSLNIHMAHPTYAAVTSMHMYGWRKGLKTGLYYLRSKPAKEAVKVTVDPTLQKEAELQRAQSMAGAAAAEEEQEVQEEQEEQNYDGWVCRMEEGCLSCGS